MLSVILYGRNDSHGYNLHKRAVLSLNTLAELLDDRSDEIIFVDYNTPDDLPTFPEAIHDLLTPKVKRRLRIIRVRPDFHRQRYLSRTHLEVLEPIARNIGLRRSNPDNLWVLSTNTDMIFVPNSASSTMSDILRHFESGMYHLPRFEIPEMVWESLDRLHGADVISRMRWLSARLHLDDVVLSHQPVVYDAPGDFQLARRADLFAIDGFNEEMLLGWHVDSNLAARLALKLGPVRTAVHHLRGYHCSHTRQASVYHAADAAENDFAQYVFHVQEPDLPMQRLSWGFPEETFEEIRVGVTGAFDRYARAMSSAISTLQDYPCISFLVPEAFNRLEYNIDHVLPYLADLLANLPSDTVIAYFGCGRELLMRLAVAVPELLPNGQILVPSGSPCLTGEQGRMFATCSVVDCLAGAGVWLFEFSAPETEPNAELSKADQERLAAARRILVSAIDFERARLADASVAPRRFILVNAINNRFEAIVRAHLSATRAPFSTRILHGTLRQDMGPRPPGTEDQKLRKALQMRMGRLLVPPISELATAKEILRICGGAGKAAGADRIFASYRTLLSALEACDTCSGEALREAEVASAALILGKSLQRSVRCSRESLGPGGGLFDIWEWEDPDWFWFARRHMGGQSAADWFRRTPAIWERITILRLLQLNGLSNGGKRILVCDGSHSFLALVSSYYATVVAARLRRGGRDFVAPPPHDSRIPPGEIFESSRLRAWPGESGRLFDAIVIPKGRLFLLTGNELLPRVLAELRQLLIPGGRLIFSGQVQISRERGSARLTLGDLRRGRLPSSFGRNSGFAQVLPTRLTISAASLERCATRTIAGRTIEATCSRSRGAVTLKGVFVLERRSSGETQNASARAANERGAGPIAADERRSTHGGSAPPYISRQLRPHR